MFGLGKTTTERADLIVELRPNGMYRICKDSRRHAAAYTLSKEGIEALLFIKECDVEDRGLKI